MSGNQSNEEQQNTEALDPREVRGLQIAATKRLRHDGDKWTVPSQYGTDRYTVYLSTEQCSCPDHETRGVKCKHIFAAEYTLRREIDEDGSERVTETVRVTYPQPWHEYNAAQVAEGHEVPRLLASLCSLIDQPEQHRGRPRAALSDVVFSATMKVYSGFSSRRVSSALAEAEADGLILHAPAYNTLNDYLADDALTPVLTNMIQVSSLPLAAIEDRFAIDSTGFSTGRFERWYMKRYGKTTDRREWVKLHALVGVDTQIVTAAEVTDWQSNDSPHLIPLLTETARNFTMREVSADKGYISRANVAAIEAAGATPLIPFRRDMLAREQDAGTAWERMYHMFAYRRDEFLARYHQRSNVESTFSAMKRKFGDSLRTRTFSANVNETLAKVLCQNLTVVVKAMHEFEITPDFQRLVG